MTGDFIRVLEETGQVDDEEIAALRHESPIGRAFLDLFAQDPVASRRTIASLRRLFGQADPEEQP